MSLRHVLLALLSKEPNTGYGIGRLLHGQLCHLWRARLQQIYTELSKLEAQGLVQVESVALSNRPAKKTYSLTPGGYRALDHWLAQPPTPAALKNDLVVRLYCLERLPVDVAVRRLEEQRDGHEQTVRELRQQIAACRPQSLSDLGRVLTLEAAVAHAEAQAAWCRRALSLLQQASESQRAPRQVRSTAPLDAP